VFGVEHITQFLIMAATAAIATASAAAAAPAAPAAAPPSLVVATNSQDTVHAPWMCLVLDIDGTLIDEDTMEARPHLAHFLQTCFRVCAHVAIWTAAGQEWLDQVLHRVLRPRLTNAQQFAFTWTGMRCSMTTDKYALWSGDMYAPHIARKRLAKTWKGRQRRTSGWQRNATFIIDDTPRTYAFNYGHAIPIPTFRAQTGKEDTCLLHIASWLEHITSTHVTADDAQLRFRHKRQWASSSSSVIISAMSATESTNITNAVEFECATTKCPSSLFVD